MKQTNLLSRSALLCLLISSSGLALAPSPRVCRQMWGRPLAFRQSRAVVFGLRPVGAKPLTALPLDGSAQLFRTSVGKAECLSVDFRTGTATILQSDPSVEQFWAEFKVAVQKGDKPSVASMSRFPIEMPYGVPKIRTRTQLARRWRDLFSVQANAAKCFEDAKPVVDPAASNRFTVGCKDEAGNEVVVYGFLRTRNGWRLISLDNINE